MVKWKKLLPLLRTVYHSACRQAFNLNQLNCISRIIWIETVETLIMWLCTYWGYNMKFILKIENEGKVVEIRLMRGQKPKEKCLEWCVAWWMDQTFIGYNSAPGEAIWRYEKQFYRKWLPKCRPRSWMKKGLMKTIIFWFFRFKKDKRFL